MNCSLDNLDFDEAVEKLVELGRRLPASYVVTPNVDHLMRLRKDEEFRDAYESAALRLADGAPILWAAKLQGQPLRSKLSGSDLVPALCRRAAAEGLGVFFLGGRPGAAERAAHSLQQRFPGLRVRGTLCPSVGFQEDPEQNSRAVQAVRRSGADILFVGLGAPKQELWIRRNLEKLRTPLSLGIGASIDFEAGMQKRAPVWMQGCGLEWAYRLLREPRRMASRYLIRDLPYVLFLLRLLVRRTW